LWVSYVEHITEL